MDRRDFLKLSSLAGLSIAVPYAGTGWASDESAIPGVKGAPFTGLLLVVEARGGWDPTLHVDPKPDLSGGFFGSANIIESGNIKYGPVPGAQELFDAYYNQTMVLNGIDMSTNSHDAGQRHFASGNLGEGYPAMAALVAGAVDSTLALSYLTYGGYDKTFGLVAPNRGLNSSELRELAYPHRQNPNDDNSAHYHSPTTENIIAMAREARANAKLQQDRLPRFIAARNSMIAAQAGADELRLLEEVLPEPSNDGTERNFQMIMAAHKAGLCVAANVTFGGFDTHSDHLANQVPRQTTLFNGVKFALDEAERQGIVDKVTVVIGSDFGRTPGFNENAGKDHWSTGTNILIGRGVPGNKVVGASDEGHYPRYIDPETFEPTDDEEAGVRLEPRHTHLAVRRIFEVEGSDADTRFYLDRGDLNPLDA